MKISIDLEKSIDKNASIYFDKAKVIAKKIQGAKEALEQSEKKLSQLKKQKSKEQEEKQKESQFKERKKQWYEKFRWFLSSSGLLVVGGRDATTNEIIIKKHTEPGDVVFHTDMAGSPFFVIKTGGADPDKQALQETADATAIFSRAWKLGLSITEVFYVKPEQVTKKAKSGEFLTKGAFMIEGKTTYLPPSMNCAIGLTKSGELMCGPTQAVQHHCPESIDIIQGREKPSTVAKTIKHKWGAAIDDIVRILPTGTLAVKGQKNKKLYKKKKR